MPITNGTISLLRRVRTGDFEHIEPNVTLSFTVEPSEDATALARTVSQIVDAEYRYLLNPTPAAEPAKATRGKAATKPNPGDVVIPAGPAPVAAALPNGSAQPTAPTTAPVTAPSPLPGASLTPLPASTSSNGAASPLPGAPAQSPPAATLPGTVEPASTAGTATAALPAAPAAGAAIANTALNDAVMKRLTELFPTLGERAQPKIMELVGEFTGAAANLADIAQEHRQFFLDRLKALA